MSSDGTTRCGKGSDASSERGCLLPSTMRCTNCVCDSFYMTTIILWLSPTIEPLPRKEFNEALKALRKLRVGCAFMPSTEDFYIGLIVSQMEKEKKELSKWWAQS